MDAAQEFGVTGLPLGGTQPDKLVGQDRAGRHLALDDLKAGIGLQPGHKPDAALVQLVKPGIIQIGPVKDQQIVRLEVQVLDSPTVMGFTVGDEDALGQQPGENGVELDGPLAGPELAQGKTAAQRSMVVASMILISGASWGWVARSLETRSYSL